MTTQSSEVCVQAQDIQLVDVDHLVPNPKNPNKHPEKQIERLMKLIQYQGFRNPIIVSERTGFMVVGHGRLEAAKRLGMTKVPVIRQRFDDEAMEYAYLVSDNTIAEWAETDLSQVNADFLELGPDLDIELLGIKDFKVDPAELDNDDNTYTGKIEAPVYEPASIKPKITELYDTKKTDKLIEQIREKNLPYEVELFLIQAAARHTVFNYQKIADFYAHSDEDTQDLMEKSALVIIDYDKAIQHGFVELSKAVAKAYTNG